jgi:hypothetical protein
MPKPNRSALSSIAIKGQGARPEPLPEVGEQLERVALTYRASVAVHETLRRLSFEERRPIQEMLDEAVARWLDGRAS